nr:hypothetical protein [Phytoactinopolyspora endophytica]
MKQEIEDLTDDLASDGLAGLSSSETGELIRLLQPQARAIIDTGDIPLDSPMGLDLWTVARS